MLVQSWQSNFIRTQRLLASLHSACTLRPRRPRSLPTPDQRSLLFSRRCQMSHDSSTLAEDAQIEEIQGTLFRWGSKGVKVGFRSGSSTRHFVLLGGLTDGLLPTKYTVPLSRELARHGWCTVQAQLSSSYSGYGAASLAQDAEELDELLGFLRTRLGCAEAALMGHSTGCQDVVAYLGTATAQHRDLVTAAVLQAPTSDREFLASLPSTPALLTVAEAMIREGRACEMMPRDADPLAPITAYRFHSLAAVGGDDDLFSSDLTDGQLAERLGHMRRWRTLILLSEKDEYVPANIDKRNLLNRLCHAMNGSEGVIIEGGNHSLSNATQGLVEKVVAFVLTGKN